MARKRIGYCDSSGTLLHLPDRGASMPTDDDRSRLARGNLVITSNDWHNPIAWLDQHGRGCTLRIRATEVYRPDRQIDGPIRWDDESRISTVLWLAESLALRARNRWFAVCAYDGFSAECRPLQEHPTFEAFRGALPDLIAEQDAPAPGPELGVWPESDDLCVVHKVWGPAYRG